MNSLNNPAKCPRAFACALVFAVLLAAPTAFAQKGMTKGEYLDYLTRTGRASAPTSHEAGPMIMGAHKTQGPADVKINTLDVGNVRARIRNTGTLGYDRDGFCYEFPFNSQITYRWTLGPMIAGKRVVDGEERKFISGGAFGAVRGTTEDEYRPLAGFDAGTYDATQNLGIAFSDKPATWPASWPTLNETVANNGDYVISAVARDAFLSNPAFDPISSGTAAIGPSGFPGVVGGEVRAPREAYFVITDNDPAEPAGPIPMDVRVDVWGLQWDDFVNRNFIVYRLLFTNIGDEPLTDVYVGIHDDPDAPEQGSNEWTDDFAYLIPPGLDADADGVPDEGADPRSDVNGDGVYTEDDILLWNTVYLWDGDDKSEGFLASKVGWVGLKFLETPDNPATGESRGVTALDIFQYDFAPNTDDRGYDQMAGTLHMQLADDDPQQGGGTPIMEPTNVEPHPDDVFGIANSYGPDVTIVASSGPYTLQPGESLPFTFASVHGSSRADLVNNAKLTQILFNNDYNAPSGPPIPHVEAVPGDGMVTLYWDDTAEKGIYPDGTVGDPLTGNNAFQGYKIYRSDDGGQTFGQPIIDVNGTVQGFIPLAIYDLADGVSGESETRRYFNQGGDTGLEHKFVDTNVRNGQEYIYAVVAYDGQDGPVPPLETPINLADPNAPGDNTVLVRPEARPAGIVPGVVDAVARKSTGSSDVESIALEVVDPTALISGTYQITFSRNEEGVLGYTVSRGGEVVTDLAGNIVTGQPFYDPETDNAVIFDGVRAIVENVAFDWKSAEQTVGDGLEVWQVVNLDAFGWGNPEGLSQDYEIRFTDKLWTFTDYFDGDAVTAPFEIYNTTTGTKVHAEIREADVDDNATWDPGERIYVVNTPYPENEADAAFWLGAFPGDYVYRIWFGDATTWAGGDTFAILSNKPMTAEDIFEFDVQGPDYSKAQLEEDIEEISVVPNPFVVSSQYDSGAFGVSRQLQFHQLPEQCTIRIFTTSGELVQVVEHDGGSMEPWNLQTYNGQEVAYGVYLYIVQTPDGVEKTGKFAVIK